MNVVLSDDSKTCVRLGACDQDSAIVTRNSRERATMPISYQPEFSASLQHRINIAHALRLQSSDRVRCCFECAYLLLGGRCCDARIALARACDDE